MNFSSIQIIWHDSIYLGSNRERKKEGKEKKERKREKKEEREKKERRKEKKTPIIGPGAEELTRRPRAARPRAERRAA